MNSNWRYGPEILNSGRNRQYFVPRYLETWWMTLEIKRAPFLYYIKLCAPCQIHRWSQTWVTVQKRPVWVKIGEFLSRMTLKLDRWPWKTLGHLFYATLSFVQHFKAIGEFKLNLRSGNAQFGSKSAIFCPVWPWNLTDDLQKTIGHLSYADSRFVYHSIAISELKLELQSENLQFGLNSMIF